MRRRRQRHRLRHAVAAADARRVRLSKIETCARPIVPLVYAPAPTAGTTAPASVAAVVVTGNAEVLSGLVLHQLVNPGAPFVYGAGCDTLDMRTMVNPYVSPEWSMGCQAGRDLAGFYGLPSFSYGGYSDSKMLDEQWAAETAMTAVMGALAARHAPARRRLSRDGHADVVRVDRARGTSSPASARRACARSRSTTRLSPSTRSSQSGRAATICLGGIPARHYREFWMPRLFDKAPHDRWHSYGATR